MTPKGFCVGEIATVYRRWKNPRLKQAEASQGCCARAGQSYVITAAHGLPVARIVRMEDHDPIAICSRQFDRDSFTTAVGFAEADGHRD
jgi:hypothetical protein